MISFFFSFEIISVVIFSPNIFWWVAASVADTASVKSNGIETLLASGLNTYFVKGKQVFSNSPKSLPKNSSGYPILYNWVFDNFILAEEPFAKVLQSFRTCILLNSSLCGKLVSWLESPTTVDISYSSTIFYCRF